MCILPADAHIAGYALPKSSFTLYIYPGPGSPVMVAVDTEPRPLVSHQPRHVDAYRNLYQRIRDAALAPADSAALVEQLADDAQR